jgi:hypothetical protein
MANPDVKEYRFLFNRDNFKNILDSLKDLSKIHPMIKMKMDESHVLFYSRAGAKSATDSAIHAFKSFVFPVEDFVIADEYKQLDFIFLNGPNFVHNAEMFLNRDSDVSGKFLYKEKDRVASMIYLSDGRLNFNYITGDYKQIKDISRTEIDTKMNPAYANFSIDMTNDQYMELKKLTTKNKSETLSVKIKNGRLEFFDNRWSLHICDVVADDDILSFNNKYFKSINPSDIIRINFFDQFLLIKDNNINLLIGLELSEFK